MHMLWTFIIFITGLLLSCGLNVMLLAVALSRRANMLTKSFAGLLLATGIYSFAYALEISSATLEGALFWIKVEYLGIVWIPFCWIIMVLEYAGKGGSLTKKTSAYLAVIPAISLAAVLTNDYHHLYYRAVSFVMHDGFLILQADKGLWYWAFQTYLNLTFLSGGIVLIVNGFRASLQQKKQIAVILTGSLLPLVAYYISLLGRAPFGLDLSPFAFALAGPLYAVGLFRYRLFNLVPLAYENIFAGMNDGVLVLDIQNRIIDYNPAAKLMVKTLSRRMIGAPAAEVFAGNDRLHACFEPDAPGKDEVRMENREGDVYYQYRVSPVINRQKEVIGSTVTISDITEQRLLLDKLHTLATIDVLTATYNRGHFIELARAEFSAAQEKKQPVSVILLDIDNFKLINDTHGHEAGDKTLGSVAQACLSCLRDSDLFCRYGGDEFAAFLPNTSMSEALQVAERLRKSVNSMPVNFGAAKAAVIITASFGVANAGCEENIGLDELLIKADEALYRAKEDGRNAVRAMTDGGRFSSSPVA